MCDNFVYICDIYVMVFEMYVTYVIVLLYILSRGTEILDSYFVRDVCTEK